MEDDFDTNRSGLPSWQQIQRASPATLWSTSKATRAERLPGKGRTGRGRGRGRGREERRCSPEKRGGRTRKRRKNARCHPCHSNVLCQSVHVLPEQNRLEAPKRTLIRHPNACDNQANQGDSIDIYTNAHGCKIFKAWPDLPSAGEAWPCIVERS